MLFSCSSATALLLPSASVPNLARSKCYKDLCLCNLCQVWLGKEMLMAPWNHSLCSWVVCARFMQSMVTLEALWKVQGERSGERTPLEVFVEGLKMQSSQFPSCMAILWSGDIVSCQRREYAQFLSVRRMKPSRWQNTLILFYLSICWQFFKQF